MRIVVAIMQSLLIPESVESLVKNNNKHQLSTFFK